MFPDDPGAKARDGVHFIFADEKFSDEAIEPSPPVSGYNPSHPDFKPLGLPALVMALLNSSKITRPIGAQAENHSAGDPSSERFSNLKGISKVFTPSWITTTSFPPSGIPFSAA